MFIHGKNALLAGLIVLCGAAMSARADIVFNFNSLAPGATDTQIAAYMDGLLSCANCVTVTGASVDTTYSGDSHVVGNNGKSLTLGTSDGATNNSTLTPSTTYDSFLSNVTNSAQTISSEIIITFSQAVNVTGFDYEIFPDMTCSSPSNCNSGTPDFTFATNGNVGSPIFTTNAVFPSTSGTDGSSIHSPNSCPVWWSCNTEQSAQYIGTWSGNLTGVTQLDFIDWPAAIGVDNIKLSTSTVPEPRFGAILLGGLLLAGLAGRKRFGFARS
jgi:hypothetical protein